jgi:integrase
MITEHDAWTWGHALIGEGRSAGTAHDVWLISARTVYNWARENRLTDDNPFANVKITVPKKSVTRDRSFTAAEAATVLTAASAVAVRTTFTAAQHWCPWLAAYSGARVGELTQLRAEDVKEIDGVWCMVLTPDAGTMKTKHFRNVPLHSHLIKLGFLSFASGKSGPLFYNPSGEAKEADATNPQRPRAVKCRERLGAWSRQLVPDKGVAPNHAWRHTWKTIAARAGISDSLSDAMTGHASRTVAGRYLHPTVGDMATALRKFPRYRLD